ncbi:MAG: two-component regulator propeller domain-containing protein [Chitinophagales bacterium]
MKALLLPFLCFSLSLSSQAIWTIFNKSNSPLPDNAIRAVETDKNGNLWVGTDEGLAMYDGTNWTITDTSNSNIPGNQIRSIAFDSLNHLWVGTLQYGLGIYDGTNWIKYTTANSILPDDQVRSIAFDSSNTAWIGTVGGVIHISDEGWILYDMFNSPLGANNVNKIFVDKDDVKWIGTVNGGISRKQGNTWSVYKNTNSGLTDNTVFDLESDYLGNIWFATPAQGLGRYNGTAWYYRLTANSNIPTNSITCIEVVSSTDVKYMGTFDKGLVRWNNAFAFDSFTMSNSPMPDNYINCMKYAGNGKVWIGTASEGLVLFQDTTTFNPVSGIKPVQDRSIGLFPNPATDHIIVNYSDAGNGSLRIFDLTGAVLVDVVFSNSLSSLIPIDGFAQGMYVVQIVSRDSVQSATFVKQ